MRNIRTRACAAAAIVVTLTTLGLASPASAAGKGNSPTLGKFAFAQSTVDVTAGPAANTMTWSVTDKAKGAANIWGDITIRQQGAKNGTYVGPAYDVTFGTDWDGTIHVLAASGNAASSTYTYAWPVPQYTGTAKATWVVTQVAIRDDLGNTRTSGTPKGGSFTATDLVDSTAPAYEELNLAYQQPDAVYVGAGAQPVDVEAYIVDEESGLAGGSITFTGPHSAKIVTPFQIFIQDGLPTCGTDEGTDTDVLCDIDVSFPAGTASGVWTLTELDLTDNDGNTGHYTTDLPSVTVHVTSNTTVQASGFALTPSQADNWVQSAPLTLTMATSGASGGIATVNLQTTCAQMSTTPTDLGGGTISIPLLLPVRARSCEITGVELVDGAGNYAVYGSAYGSSPIDLVSTEVPDTTAPVATNAYLNETTFTENGGLNVAVWVTVHSAVGVIGYDADVYDANGNPVQGSYGGLTQTTDGVIEIVIQGTDVLPPGTYTVGFFINDVGGLSTGYDFPGRPLPAWGPLQFTIAAA